jgi:hypothetical protein
MKNYGLYKMSDIPVADLNNLIVEKVNELHLDCGLKMDQDVVAHTVKKTMEILSTKYKSWYWDEFCAVCKMGITGSYGTNVVKINFQTISTWMKKAEQGRGSAYATKSLTESNQFKKELSNVDYSKAAKNWAPVMFLRFDFGIRFEKPFDLKNAIARNEISQVALQSLSEKYPYVLTVGYPL